MEQEQTDFTDDKNLLQQIRAGDERAFRFLYESYYPRLRGYAARFVADEEAVRDIVQESFLKFWERRELIEAVSLSSLLFAMVRNACINYLKHLQLSEQCSLDYLDDAQGSEALYNWDFGLGPEQELLYKELQQQVALVMESLPARCREVFRLSRFQHKKNREIAALLHISTTAVEKHIAKALARFSTYFKARYPVDVYLAVLAFLISGE